MNHKYTDVYFNNLYDYYDYYITTNTYSNLFKPTRNTVTANMTS